VDVKKRDWLYAGLIWVALTVIGEVIAVRWSILPAQLSEEAVVVDDAFRLLVYLAIPVLTFVIVVLAYSGFAYRAGDAAEDGDGVATSRPVVTWWVLLTSLLAAFVFVNPGLVGLRDLRSDTDADIVIHADARRFRWTVIYPNGEESTDELVIPVDTRIKFEVTSRDVLHSFWIPAFRMKIDAVPGRVTEIYVTPSATGTLNEVPGLRVQCAELCGVGHAQMMLPVRVVERGDYEAFLASLEEEHAPPPPPPGDGEALGGQDAGDSEGGG
jgi:cytochrome c oxidase subunit 2